jgi:hypothetical protein
LPVAFFEGEGSTAGALAALGAVVVGALGGGELGAVALVTSAGRAACWESDDRQPGVLMMQSAMSTAPLNHSFATESRMKRTRATDASRRCDWSVSKGGSFSPAL